MEDFKRGWRHFEFIAAAKEWNAQKQLVGIPTLLKGKVIENYIELPEATKTDLGHLKMTLRLLATSKQFKQQN